jgi:hypothetical protein
VLIASRRTLRRSALAAAVVLAALVAAGTASAAKTESCAKQVIADWYDNGRVDHIYPLHCYREAIKILPVDVRDYSSAREDILRALQYAQQGKPDPGDSGSGTGSGTGKPGNNSNNPGGTPGTGSGPGDTPGTDPQAPVDTSGPSAVPIPLIVLAAIAGLLLVLGAAGYLTRRSANRHDGDDPLT